MTRFTKLVSGVLLGAAILAAPAASAFAETPPYHECPGDLTNPEPDPGPDWGGPDDIANPTPDDDPGPGHDGPGDIAIDPTGFANQCGPHGGNGGDDDDDPVVEDAGTDIVVANPTFTG